MHIFFSGIGGTAIGPLAMIAKQAGYDVSGSDQQESQYIQYLREHGIEAIHIGQDAEQIADVHTKKPIDWYVFSSAVAIENPDAPELKFCQENDIKTTKRDELLNQIITDKQLKLIAIAGTHGKTTTTAMMIWLLQQLAVPISYSVGAKLSFGEMGHFDPTADYFVLEADEFDRNFLSFKPFISVISGVDYDHPDIYPTREEYNQAFSQFISQSDHTVIWTDDAERLGLQASETVHLLNKTDAEQFSLGGRVNREDASIVAQTATNWLGKSIDEVKEIMNRFPGLSRRFEQLATNLYTDYAHTPEKIRGALQTAQEVGGDNVVVVYEGLHNTRQHFIKEELAYLFDDVKQLYVVPSYRAREDENLEDLTPEKIVGLLSKPDKAEAADLDEKLKTSIKTHLESGDLVLCLSAGGGGSLDEWLRQEFKA